MTDSSSKPQKPIPPFHSTLNPESFQARSPWLLFVVPFIVYSLFGLIAPPNAPSAKKLADLEASMSFNSSDESLSNPLDNILAQPTDKTTSNRDSNTDSNIVPDSDSLEPASPTPQKIATSPPLQTNFLGLTYKAYPYVYTAQIVATFIAMLLAAPGYRETFKKISPLAFGTGVLGLFLWVGISKLGLEASLPAWFVSPGERAAYDPLLHLKETPNWAYGFLAIRLFGLALVIPIIEEFVLRGFILRYLVHDKWWQVPFAHKTSLVLLVGCLVYPAASHPAEAFAAVAWFSMGTWLMFKTKNIWDCVVAHCITNLLLGIYVIYSGEWYFM